jgi:DNA-binding HxlR family transcriptional regulator
VPEAEPALVSPAPASAAASGPTNILADRLRRLEREGLVRAEPYSEHPPRFAYSLTRQGRELGPALDALATWGLRYFPGTVRTIPPAAELADQAAGA